jgi:5-methylcytosine-specific restriction endonuclease McrA
MPDHRHEFWGPREKTSYRCADCGRTRQEAQQIDVHHVDPGGADHPDNLVGLCRRCHLAARHRRDRVPGDGAFAPAAPSSTGPRTPRQLSPGP